MLKQFICDRRGSSIENYGLTGAAIALCIIPAAAMFEKNYDAEWTQSKLQLITAAASRATRFASNAQVDYTPTGTIPGKPGQTIILDPCTGKIK